MSSQALHDLVVLAGAMLPRPGAGAALEDGWIAVDAGHITAVGSGPPPVAAHIADHRNDIVLPGFVNTHSHLIGALVRGLGGDLATRIDAPSGRPTVAIRAVMNERDAHAAARLAILELLLSGVTTTADSQAALKSLEPQADGTLRALTESGMRAVFFRSSIDRTDFFSPGHHDTAETAVAEIDRLAATWGGRRVTIGVEAMALHRVTDGLLDELVDAARDRKMPFALHGPYSRAAADHATERFGAPVVEVLADRGAVSDRTLLYHPVHVSAEEIRLLADRGAGVAVCPVDNMLIGAHAAPVDALLSAGVRVGLGLDQPNDGHDMFQLMKATILQQRSAARSPDFGSPDLALELATTGGAGALRLGHEVGAIEPGRAADFVVLDGDHPTLQPRTASLSNVVYAAGPQAVKAVYIEGRVVVRDGRHTDWDHREVSAMANEAMTRCLQRAGLR